MSGPQVLRSWLDAIGDYGKFVTVVGAGFVNVGLILGHYIDEGTYMGLTIGTVGAYIAGHSAEAIFSRGVQDADPKP